MKTAEVVIGAGFGDEGKGHLTDYYASKFSEDCLVVRFNGGAQAGHTVQTPEGERHVFSHFGAGTLVGSKTYLSRFFVVNPIIYLREAKELTSYKPEIYVNELCTITTPYDMLINQIVEESRGEDKHGSCGLGFNETIERSFQERYRLIVRDLSSGSLYVLAKLLDISKNYVPERLSKLGVKELSKEYEEILLKDGPIIWQYIEDLKFFYDTVTVTSGYLNKWKGMEIVFEGAQGLLLDEEHEYFPYVTRSKTGLNNVTQTMSEFGVDTLNVTYVTRAYTTRHGIGPLPYELDKPPYVRVVDTTNIFNKNQGKLRFGWLDLITLSEGIRKDLRSSSSLGMIKLLINCLDQVDGEAKFIMNDVLEERSIEGFVNMVSLCTGLSNVLVGLGPDRNDIVPHREAHYWSGYGCAAHA